MSGNSSAIASVLSPKRNSIVITCPPGSVIRLVSWAPRTEAYQAAAALGSRVTRWLVRVLITATYILSIQTVYTSYATLPVHAPDIAFRAACPPTARPTCGSSWRRPARGHPGRHRGPARRAQLQRPGRQRHPHRGRRLPRQLLLLLRQQARRPGRARPAGRGRRPRPRGGLAGQAAPAGPVAALRTGITAGAELWRASAPVLRAIVENWRTDPRLETLWT